MRCWFLTSFGFHWWSLLDRENSHMIISIANNFHYLIFEWSFISKLSINCVSDEFRSPDWSGLLTTELLATNGTALLFRLVDIGCRISRKESSENEDHFKGELKFHFFVRLGADGSNRFCETGNALVLVWGTGVSRENRSSVSNWPWPLDAGFDEEKKSASVFVGCGGEVVSLF